MNNDNILLELINNQRKNISNEKKLLFNDLKRLSKYLNKSIFTNNNLLNENDCSLWDGNTTNNYINFYLNKKKKSLHRILYYNYINDISDSEYIKFYCTNKNNCCNINHFYKVDNKMDIKLNSVKSKKLSNNIINFN
jgi:hypothetical protein